MSFYDVLWNIVEQTVKEMRENGATEEDIRQFLEAVNSLIKIYETFKSLKLAE